MATLPSGISQAGNSDYSSYWLISNGYALDASGNLVDLSQYGIEGSGATASEVTTAQALAVNPNLITSATAAPGTPGGGTVAMARKVAIRAKLSQKYDGVPYWAIILALVVVAVMAEGGE